jgi:hypothetical protein
MAVPSRAIVMKKQRRTLADVLLGTLLLLCWASPMAAAFSQSIVVHRRVAQTTPASGYQATLQAWKENLGLWFLLPPIILEQGHPETGVGFVLVRIPPAGLREGIVNCQWTEEGQQQVRMDYKVLNPSYFTWPVADHQGEILWRATTSSDSREEDAELEWTVQWNPLPLISWIPYGDEALMTITRFIIERAATYVVQLCDQKNKLAEQEL